MPDASTNPAETTAQAAMSCPPPTEPGEQHRWLHRLVGAWSFEGEMPAPPGQPPQKFSGTEMVRDLGGLWVVGEGDNALPEGGSMDTLVVLGYDPAKDAFVGSFVCSMFTHMWLYRGQLMGKRLVLATEGPNMEDGAMTAYEDIVTIEDADHRTLTSRMREKDGNWRQVVSMRYQRLPD